MSKRLRSYFESQWLSVPVVSAAVVLGLPLAAGAQVGPVTIIQDATVSQNDPTFIKWEAENFDTTSAPTPDTWWVSFVPSGGSTGGKSLRSPWDADANGDRNRYVTYKLNVTDPGTYYLYGRRFGGGDSFFVGPDFGQAPVHAPNTNINPTTPTEDRRNRVEAIPNNAWLNLNTHADAPGATYYTSGSKGAYTVTTPGTLVLTFEGRDRVTEFDRFALSTNAALTTAQLDALTYSPTTVNSPVQVPSFNVPADSPRGGLGTVGVREVIRNGAIDSNPTARVSLTNVGAGALVRDHQASAINFRDPPTGGTFGNIGGDLPFGVVASGDVTAGAVDNLSMVARGTVRIPAGQGGTYTFGVNSDDSFALLFPGKDFQTGGLTGGDTNVQQFVEGRALTFGGGRGTANSTGRITLPEGDHDFILTYHEGTGGTAGVELFSIQSGTVTNPATRYATLVGGQRRTINYSGAPRVTSAGGWETVVLRDDPAVAGTGPGADITAAANQVNSYFTDRTAPAGTVLGGSATNAVVNYADPENAGANRGGTERYPGENAAADDNNFVTGARARMTVDAAGAYTFMVLSDDQFQLQIPGTSGWTIAPATGGANLVALADGFRSGGAAPGSSGCCNDSFGTVTLGAGEFDLWLASREGTGGASLSVWVAPGTLTAFDVNQFQLLGENNAPFTSGQPLELVPEPGTAGLLGLAGLGLLARRRRRA